MLSKTAIFITILFASFTIQKASKASYMEHSNEEQSSGMSPEDYKKLLNEGYNSDMNVDHSKLTGQKNGQNGFPGSEGEPATSMNLNDVEPLGEGLFHGADGIDINHKDPNEELRAQFMNMFEEYASMAGSDEEKKRRMAVMGKEKDQMKKNPSKRTAVFSHQMGSRMPNEDFERPHEKPLREHHIHHGNDKKRIPKNHKGDHLEEENRNNIKFIKGNVHISKHITQKIAKQYVHMKEIGMTDHSFNFGQGSAPELQHLGDEEKEWFMEYQKQHLSSKEKLDSNDFSVLHDIGLSDDIPGALCVIASLKPGVHEEGQHLLTEKYNIPLTGGKTPTDVKGHDHHKDGYQVVEKVVASAIEKCRLNLARRVKKFGFIEVARFIDALIALYVPLKTIKHYFKFDIKVIKSLDDMHFSVDQLKLKMAMDHLNTHIGASFKVGNRLLEEIVEFVRTPESKHFEENSEDVADL